ncbi:uncharacterized protein palb2 [Periophthalmus magnuspinnatus]|uniref:uncharacterized protein palb2 n=1 Tax=Periophthalmus magnuspinnatus TaxID=409849 RepID=UPI00243653B5|nr:uncharacterized protein palb2 [Periophthalmus magnuspinnatus]
MEDRLGDLLHCEEQLRSTLHNNDKEKLRRKLALLQKEYLRTVQRLKRAERVASVRKHVRNQITRHNHHEQTESAAKPTPSSAMEQEETKESYPGRGHTQRASPGLAGAVEKSPEKCKQTVCSDIPTSDSSQDSTLVPKSSPALRLRSRRSRLRWEKRSAQSDPPTANSHDQPKKTQEGEEERLNDPPVLHESLFSPYESPSLLLPHWNLQGHVQKEETANQQLVIRKGKDMVSNSEEKIQISEMSPVTNSIHSHLTLNCHTEDAKVAKEETTKQQQQGVNMVSLSQENLSTSLLFEGKQVSPPKDNNKNVLKVLHVYENGKHQAEDTKVEKEKTANQQRTPEKGVDVVSTCQENLSDSACLQFEAKDISPHKDNNKNQFKEGDAYENGTSQAEDAQVEKEENANHQLTPEKVVHMVSNNEEKSSNFVSLLFEAKVVSKLEDVYVNGKHRAEDATVKKEETANQQLALEKVSNCEVKMSNFASLQMETKVSPFKDNHKMYSELEDVYENGKHQTEDTNRDSKTNANSTKVRVEKTEPEDSGQRLLDSCTLIDGLLFPAEYYVRTTRRMSVSQSQPDMNAVILSHLHKGRQRRCRGRGRSRMLNRTVSEDGSVLEASKDVSGSKSPSSCEFVSLSLDRGSVSAIATPSRARRGRRGRGGRGRGRGRLKEDMKENANKTQTNDISVALSPSCSLVPPFVLKSEDPESEEVHPKDACGADTGVEVKNEGQTLNVPASDLIFRQPNQSNTNDGKDGPEDWPSLLLPSSSQNDLLPLSPLPSLPLLKTLLRSDMLDFHLPDDQFGSLKLLKLRQIASGVEQLISTSNKTTTFTNHYAHSPPLSPVSPSPTPETEYVSVSPIGKANQVLVENFIDSNERENIQGNKFEILNQEKQVGCSSPEIYNSEPSEPEYTNVANSFHLNHPNSEEQNSQNYSEDQMSKLNGTPLEKKGMVKDRETLPENKANSDNNATMLKSSGNADSECLNVEISILENDSHVLEIAARSDRNIPPKNNSAFQNSPQNFTENILTKTEKLEKTKLTDNRTPSQLLLSPSLCSSSCSFTLPPVGFTPRLEKPEMGAVCPLSPPLLTPPPAHSLSSEALSPPTLSPCPSLRPLPPSLPPTPPTHPSHGQWEVLEQQELRPAQNQLEARAQRQGEEATDNTYTLKAGSRGSLVDMCCVPSSSGSVSVAAAGKWSVSVWSHVQTSDWRLTHTWNFQEPVLHVFPIPDTTDHFCLTLGQLEIRQVRVLSCSTLTQSLLDTRTTHMAIAAPKSRVVCCCHTSACSSLQVYTLSESSPPQAQALVPPGALLSSVAPVEGLPDALIGMDQSGSLFIWNMGTGRLLKKFTLGHRLSHSACLRGYSSNGLLFVLLQHHFPGFLKELNGDQEAEVEEEEFVFSLMAANPKNGKSVLATGLCLPKQWSGRLIATDVLGSHVLGLSQKGSVCVWDLEDPRDPQPVCATPERQGWQLARWGSPGILMTAVHTGEVTLHHYSQGTTTVITTLRHPE